MLMHSCCSMLASAAMHALSRGLLLQAATMQLHHVVICSTSGIAAHATSATALLPALQFYFHRLAVTSRKAHLAAEACSLLCR